MVAPSTARKAEAELMRFALAIDESCRAVAPAALVSRIAPLAAKTPRRG